MKSLNDILNPEEAYWRDCRKAAVKNLTDSKAKLTGPMRRALEAQLGRDVAAELKRDPAEGGRTPPKPVEVKLEKKFAQATIWQLAKWLPRVRLSHAKVQEAYTRAGEMGKIKLQRLLHPRLEMLGVVMKALMGEAHTRHVRAAKGQ